MTRQNDVVMTYIGGPTFLIEVAGLRLLTDPTFDAPREYQQGSFTHLKLTGPALQASALGMIDVVLLSHDHHFDNLDVSGRELLRSVKQVITTEGGAKRLGGNAMGLEPFETVRVEAADGSTLTVTATPARHGPAGEDRGSVIGFMLSSEAPDDGQLYVSGDTVWFQGVEETIRRFPNMRIAVLFVGAAHVPVLTGHTTFTAEEALMFARAAPNARIVPVHFEGWKHLTESRIDVVSAFDRAGMEDRLLLLPAGKPVTLPH